MLANWLFLMTVLSRATKIVEHRFGYNFGKKFHDFSGNGHHSVNGLNSQTTTHDTIGTDRGAYFYNSNSQITLPSNDLVPTYFNLPTTFTMAAWILNLGNSKSDIFTRYKDNNNYFYITKTSSEDKIKGELC